MDDLDPYGDDLPRSTEMKKPIPFEDDFDPYGKDLSPVSNGTMTFRIRDGVLSLLSDEEVEVARAAKHPKKTERPRVYRRGNKFL